MDYRPYLESAIKKVREVGLEVYQLPESDIYRIVFPLGSSTLIKEKDLIYLAPYLKRKESWPPAS